MFNDEREAEEAMLLLGVTVGIMGTATQVRGDTLRPIIPPNDILTTTTGWFRRSDGATVPFQVTLCGTAERMALSPAWLFMLAVDHANCARWMTEWEWVNGCDGEADQYAPYMAEAHRLMAFFGAENMDALAALMDEDAGRKRAA